MGQPNLSLNISISQWKLRNTFRLPGDLQGMKPSVSLLVGYLNADELSPATGQEERTETDQASGEKETKLQISELQP